MTQEAPQSAKVEVRREMLAGVEIIKMRVWRQLSINSGNYNNGQDGFELEAVLPEGINSKEVAVAAKFLRRLVTDHVTEAKIEEIQTLKNGDHKVMTELYRFDSSVTPKTYRPKS